MGSHRLGALIKGTLAAAAYCVEIGPRVRTEQLEKPDDVAMAMLTVRGHGRRREMLLLMRMLTMRIQHSDILRERHPPSYVSTNSLPNEANFNDHFQLNPNNNATRCR